VESRLLHDWTLKNIEVTWQSGVVRLDLIPSPGVTKCLTARGLIELVVPRRQEWGPSESVMSSNGPQPHSGGQRLEILMQSGDSILITAREITMPAVDR